MEGSDDAKKKVAAAVKLHILPPTPDGQALWTQPFMTNGVQIKTAGPSSITAAYVNGETLQAADVPFNVGAI